MTTSYLLGGHIPLTAAAVQEFHHRYPAIRQSYEDACEWTGYSLAELLEGGQGDAREVLHSFDAVRQAALVFGMHDVLAERGMYPDAVGGLSLGGLIGAALAGSVERREVFEMLHNHRLVPPLPPGAREQGMAVAALRSGDDPRNYYGDRRPGVYLACDYDAAYGGDVHVIVLSGYVDALEALVAENPRAMQMLEEYAGAFHSPLAQHAVDFMGPYVAGMTFRDPKIPLFSAHSAGVLATADEVRDNFLHSHVRPVAVKTLMAEVERIGATKVVGLGPGLPQGLVVEPLTMTLIVTPDELHEAGQSLR